MNIAILDFETTGLDYMNDEIIETSIKIFNKNISYNSISKPSYRGKLGSYILPEITDITNITNKMIHTGITQDKLINDIINFMLNNNVKYIIAHNGSHFDFIILKLLLKKYNFNIDIKYIDSILLIKEIYEKIKINVKNFKQGTLCNKYLIKQNNAHRAFDDVLTLEKLLNIVLFDYCRFIKKKNISNKNIYNLVENKLQYSDKLCNNIFKLDIFYNLNDKFIKYSNINITDFTDIQKYIIKKNYNLIYNTRFKRFNLYDLLFIKK